MKDYLKSARRPDGTSPLKWDEAEMDRLLEHLCGPSGDSPGGGIKRTLGVIWGCLAWELRLLEEGANTRQVSAELQRLIKAVDGLSLRSRDLMESLESPVLDFAGTQFAISSEPVLKLARRAAQRALEKLTPLPQGNPGKVPEPIVHATNRLARAYCEIHRTRFPRWDAAHLVRNEAPLGFALSVLRAWGAPGVENLEPEDVVRPLWDYIHSVRNSW